MYICVYSVVCAHVLESVCLHVHVFIYVFTCQCVHVYLCMFVCVYIKVYIMCVFMLRSENCGASLTHPGQHNFDITVLAMSVTICVSFFVLFFSSPSSFTLPPSSFL